MEAFGLLKLLQTALFPSSDAPNDERAETPSTPTPAEPPPQKQENRNAFLELIQRHDAISKHIQRKK